MNINTAIINVCDWGSTGKIAFGLLRYLQERGENAVFAMGEERNERMLATIALIAPWKFIGMHLTLY